MKVNHNAMNYILFDDKSWENLLPLTFTRPVAEIRTGILTIKEKWEKYFNVKMSYLTQTYLSTKYKLKLEDENILISGAIIPDENLIEEINKLTVNDALVKGDYLVAVRLNKQSVESFEYNMLDDFQLKEYTRDFLKIEWPWNIFGINDKTLGLDYELITNGRKSSSLSETNNVLGKENVFIEEGAKVEFATLNASLGPIYIGKDAEIMEGSIIRGPFALCDHSTLKMGAKIYGATTIGPHSKVGGEVNNSVITGYSNKAHDGFLGNSVLGEWCNIGADTNNSNLKNNYTEVRLWNYESERFIKTGLQFCGLIMGDHSKCAINTMFNTGTVIGVNTNIFGEGFPRNFIPSFSWGGARGFTIYGITKAFEVAGVVMGRRSLELSEVDKEILNYIFQKTSKYRIF